MTSEIRSNTLKNRVGLGTVSFTNTGPIVSGIVTANSFSGPTSGTTGTFSGNVDIGGDLDVDGHTNLDNVSVAGVSTFSGAVTANSTLQVVDELSISDTIVHSGDGNTKIRFPDADTFSVETAGSERLRIASGVSTFAGNVDANGDLDVDGHTNLDNVSIAGVTTSSNKVQVNSLGVGIVPIDHHHIHIESANPRILIRSTGTNAAKILFGDNSSNDSGVIEYSHSSNTMIFNTGNSPRLRIDSSGRLLIPNISSRAIGNVTAKVQLEGTSADGSAISITRNSANASPPYLNFGKSRATSTGGTTIIQNGDSLGEIRFSGADGNDLTNHAASINVEVDGTPGNNDTPGRLIFSTTSDGSSDATERLRITSTGYVQTKSELWVGGSAPVLRWRDSTHGEKATARIDGSDLYFEVNNSERLRITSGGVALFGGLTSQVADTSKLAVQGGDSNIGIIQVHAGGGESNGDLSGIAFSHGIDNATARAKAAIAFRADASGYGRGDLCLYVDGGSDNNQVSSADERLRITSTGDANIIDGNLIVANGHGIDFSANSNDSGMTSELLDDYEEGLWTPTFTTGSGSITINSSYDKCSYTKIGRLVHLSGQAVVSVNNPGGNLTIGGLPFAVVDLTDLAGRSYCLFSAYFNGSGAPDGSALYTIQAKLTETDSNFLCEGVKPHADGSIANWCGNGTDFFFDITYLAES